MHLILSSAHFARSDESLCCVVERSTCAATEERCKRAAAACCLDAVPLSTKTQFRARRMVPYMGSLLMLILARKDGARSSQQSTNPSRRCLCPLTKSRTSVLTCPRTLIRCTSQHSSSDPLKRASADAIKTEFTEGNITIACIV